ncbi:hypothetical protein QBC47DRAFT_292278 [Echria macrotheca]|uniref:Zn(2)-C6 fungal-type domain-containing protein n=1 Tax=Echria macrotheca TaxID=438768 RepID=A0AAJ0BK30_9PEZI|nr:hypothetical protein QBC47DRAFT_292278 [Echria macrotheca]
MQDIDHRNEESSASVGHRRGVSELARFALDLTWAGAADSESAARLGSYPSPPMSGSPPLPRKASQEAAERIQGTAYQAATQDAYRGSLGAAGDERAQTAVPVPPRASPSGSSALPYSYPRLEGPMTRPLQYPQQLGAGAPPNQQTYGPTHGAAPTPSLPAPQSFTAPVQQQSQDRPSSPKPQRKTKGHVASACVPCKKAHLRCTSNGKEEACIDVQHKKRGRPRLRDDRDTKFEGTRFGSATDSLRRPMAPSPYGPGSSIGMAYDDPLRRPQSYRVLKSQPAEPLAPRFSERALADANIFPAPLSIPTRAPEPAAFLTFDLEFGNASTAFLDAIARPSVKGMRLGDVVVSGERDRVSALQRQIHDERQKKDPMYLPPMFSRETSDRLLQRLGFTPEDFSQFALEWQEHLNFLGQDGQARQYSFRVGLAKMESIYVVLIWLNRPFQYPTPSPNPREITYSYQQPQQPYSQPTPVSATFNPQQSRPGDGGYGSRQGAAPGAPPPSVVTGLSPGLQSSYGGSPGRPEYSMGASYQPPRNDMVPGGRGPQTPGYQLPPIRNPQPSGSQQPDQSRVDIRGLLDRPGPSNQSQQP